MKQKAFALVLALCMSLASLPMAARAESILPEFLQNRTEGRYRVCAEIVSGEDHGTVELFADSADGGDTVYLRADPEDGYLVEIDGAPEMEYIGLDLYAITMPEEALSLRVRFLPAGGGSYEITVSGSAMGELTVHRTSAREGERVVIEAVPGPGCALKKLHVTDSDGNRVRCIRLGAFDGVEVCEITMPASALSVRAEFEELVPSTITCFVTPAGRGEVILSQTAACPGETVSARVRTSPGYAVRAVFCTADEVEWGRGDAFTFRMPAAGVEIWVELYRRPGAADTFSPICVCCDGGV